MRLSASRFRAQRPTEVTMTRLATVLAVAALYAGSALAQSSGNFTDTVDDALCSINSATGDESCTNQNGTNVCTTPTPGGSLTAAIKLPNSSPALLVTPSLATGLYTNIPVGANSETAAIVVTVTDTFGIPAQTVTLSPDQTCVQTVGTTPCSGPSATCKCGVVYDERFQMVTSLMGPLPVSLILSTLSAHSSTSSRQTHRGAPTTSRWHGTSGATTAAASSPRASAPPRLHREPLPRARVRGRSLSSRSRTSTGTARPRARARDRRLPFRS